jgi:hypothetical protein
MGRKLINRKATGNAAADIDTLFNLLNTAFEFSDDYVRIKSGVLVLPQISDLPEQRINEISIYARDKGGIEEAFYVNDKRQERDLSGAAPAGVRVYNNADLAIVTATPTILTFNSERHDDEAFHSTAVNTGRITFPTAGTYLFGLNVYWDAGAVGYRQIIVRKNGATNLIFIHALPIAAGIAKGMNAVSIAKFAAADYIEIEVLHTQGANLAIKFFNEHSPEFWAQRL